MKKITSMRQIEAWGILTYSMLILTGCYTYSSLRDSSPADIPPPQYDIRVKTIDECAIEVRGYHFVAVQKPKSFLYGAGLRVTQGVSEAAPFHGEIDAVGPPTKVTSKYGGRNDTVFVFKLQDGSTVRIGKSDLMSIDSSRGPGLWCAGEEIDWLGRGSPFSGPIPFDQIERIEVRKLSSWRTFALVGLGVFAVADMIVTTSSFFSWYNSSP